MSPRTEGHRDGPRLAGGWRYRAPSSWRTHCGIVVLRPTDDTRAVTRLYPSDLRASPAPVRLTLLASLCWAHQAEIIDGLVDLLVGLVHKVDVTAERKVGARCSTTSAGPGQAGRPLALAAAALDHPDDTASSAPPASPEPPKRPSTQPAAPTSTIPPPGCPIHRRTNGCAC